MNIRILTLIIHFWIGLTAYSQTDDIQIKYVRNLDKSYDFFYLKKQPGTYNIIVKLKSLKNATTNSYEGNVKDNSGFLFQLKPINDAKEIKFKCEAYFHQGNPKPNYDKDFVYLLPFKAGKNVSITKIVQSDDDLTNDKLPYNYYSNFAISNKENTVLAMRKGVVIKILNSHIYDSTSIFPIQKMNEVVIEHEDGTYAIYSGFKKNAIKAKLGQTVLPAEELGTLQKSIKNDYYLMFDTYYWANETDVFPDKAVNPYKRIHKSLDSLFYTDKGPVVLPEDLNNVFNYKVASTEDIICKELTKNEIELRAQLLNK